MKNLLCILALIIVLISCNQKQVTVSYIIDGKIEGVSSGNAFLEYSDFKDTADIRDGGFKFSGNLKKPEMCKIKIEGYENQAEFYLENSKITLHVSIDSLNKPIVTGSKTEDENKAYREMLAGFERKFKDIGNEYTSADDNRKKELEKLYEKIEWEMVDAQKQFIKDNPTSYLCINILKDIDWSFNSGREYNEYISHIDTSLNKYADLAVLKEQAARMEKVDIGKTAPDFKIIDINGENVKLSDKYSDSKYLLLDFWASTCGPCRKENKHILEAYNKFQDKGFDVFGVSTDTKKELWINAIKKDGLIWTNTCNLKKWNDNDLVKTYALRQVSANFLLDRNGKIIASNLRGDDLYTKLDVLFNKEN
jgi:thiol-disulfide isomerase/thioredoxin